MKRKVIRIVFAALLLMAACLIDMSTEWPVWARLCLYLLPYIVAGYDVVAEAAEGLMEGNALDENFLMVLATFGALFIGFLPGADAEFAEAVFVMLFFQVGELFESFAARRSRRSIHALMALRPDTACVLLPDGSERVVSPADVQVGQTVVVRAGERIPMDGIVVEGHSSLDTAALTGESLPRSVEPNSQVASGCLNITGVLHIRVDRPFGQSTASRIIAMVEDAQQSKSSSETFIRRFARVYTPLVVVGALLLALVPPFFSPSYTEGLGVWLYRALTFLVVSCPCALVFSVPLAFFGGIGGASRQGILVKGGNFVDALSRLSTVVMDKTGTLTRGVFQVQAVHPQVVSEDELLQWAAAVERYSTHPIAVALQQAGRKDDKVVVSDVEELAGHGVCGRVDGRSVAVGGERLMEHLHIAVPPCPTCQSAAGVMVHVAVDGQYAGHVLISDEVKADAALALADLRTLGIGQTVMLTGDSEKVARQVAQQVGVDEWHAQLLPAEKVEEVERLLNKKTAGTLAFVGDGINDAPVLARADIGVAMGALGSEAAIEAADVVLMDDRPSRLGLAVRLARRTVHIAHQNTWFAISVKLLVLALASAGLVGMGWAVFADVGVMVLAVLNSMRTLFVPRAWVAKVSQS